MTEPPDGNGNPAADDMSQYLQMFLDETEEQLDDLVESLLILESKPDQADELNEAFRLIHSIKGAAGMMGLEHITVLTHHLENRFEQFRTGAKHLDQTTMNLVLRCIDFLRDCNTRLRSGESLGSPSELLDELRVLEDQSPTEFSSTSMPADKNESAERAVSVVDSGTNTQAMPVDDRPGSAAVQMLTITFEPNLALVDLKARLILSRLAEFGRILSTRPTLADLEALDELTHFELVMETPADLEQLRAAADVDGVQSITGGATSQPTNAATIEASVEIEPNVTGGKPEVPREPATVALDSIQESFPATAVEARELPDSALSPEMQRTSPAETATPDLLTTDKVAETMRVDIGRLDNLMNLAGQLVINRARFVQVTAELPAMIRKPNEVGRMRDFSESVRTTVQQLRSLDDVNGEWTGRIRELEAGLELLDNQSQQWETSRRCVGDISEAVDQLTLVTNSLQRSVMETRMVPVAPLFNRFKRVVRDLAVERGKTVLLQLRGEKTELDKRMIDELGDPLVHLVRNCVDHGLETPDVRVARGKPPAGTISLEASHRGNSIHIRVRDDGGGISVERLKQRVTEQQLLTQEALDELTDAQIVEFIWHPGLSTAAEVTDVSGRGVGMDVVKTRIANLNGTVEVDSVLERGTTFTIRLPLTLAIINSLLVRINDVIFAVPIEDVREIVSVHPRDIVALHGKRTFDVRGEFVPLLQIEEIFDWQKWNDLHEPTKPRLNCGDEADPIDVMILCAGSKTIGLRVAELLGSQDIVIKSLAENLSHIRGLSGASILGDGTVCLMLDVRAVLDLVFAPKEMIKSKPGLT